MEQYRQFDNNIYFTKQIERMPAEFDNTGLLGGYDFQFEVKIEGSAEIESKSIHDSAILEFEN